MFTASAVVALVIACGSSSSDDGSSGGGDDGGSSGFGSSGTSGTSGTSGSLGSSGSSGGDLDSGLNACATDTQQAHLQPLSLMLMQVLERPADVNPSVARALRAAGK